MIRENTIDAVYPLATLLTEKNITLSPVQQSPIAELIGAGHLENPKGLDEDQAMTIEERLVKGSRFKNHDGEYVHDDRLKELSDSVAKIVKNNLQLARTVVNPMVIEAAEKTVEFVENSKQVKSNLISVKPIHYEAIFNSPLLAEMIDRHSNVKYAETKLSHGIDSLSTKEELLNLVKTGSSRFDEEIEGMFDDLSEIFVVKVFNEFFGNKPMSRKSELHEAIRDYDEGERKTVSLLVHLFSRTLLQNPKKESGLDLSSYRSYMSEILSQTGRYLYAVLAQREQDIARRVLIKTWPIGLDSLGTSKITVCVNGDIYTKWLEQGGTPETLFGSFVSDKNRSYSELIEYKDQYEKEWEKRSRAIKTTNRFNTYNYTIEGLERAVASIIVDMDDEMLPTTRDVLQKRLRENISQLKGPIQDMVYVAARRLICDTIFPHTQALNILSAIDDASKQFPEMEVREAALLATVEIVSNWVAKYMNASY